MTNILVHKAPRLGLVSTEGKSLSIRYLSCKTDDKYFYFYFEVTRSNPKESEATIYVEEINATNEIAVKDSFSISTKGRTTIWARFDKNKEFNRYMWQDGLVYQATITCDGFSAKTEEFDPNCIKEVKVEPKVESKIDSNKCLTKGDLTESKLKKVLIQLRKDEKTGQKVMSRDKTNTKNFALGEPVLDENGKKQYVERTMFDEHEDKIFSLDVTEKIKTFEANFKDFAKYLNNAFKKYQINTCLRKIHFLAQAYHETQRFLKTYEGNPGSNISGGKLYRGRGFLQITHDYNYRDFYEDYYGKSVTDEDLKKFAPKVATSMEIACMASVWYWKEKKLNQYADIDNTTKVSAAINYPKALNGKEADISSINGLEERKRFVNLLKNILDYERCCK